MAFEHVFAIAAGGAVGACSRALAYIFAERIEETNHWSDYPRATFVVNTLGSLILGLLTGLVLSNNIAVPVRDLVGTGFCGSLTTFSTFSNDSFLLIQKRHWLELTLHIGSNLIFGFGAAALGYYVGKHI
ncbi:MAG: CrcB family protein [Xenococcaceae cyanobacterium]